MENLVPRGPASEGTRQLLLGPAGTGKSRLIRNALLAAIGNGFEAEALLLVPTASYRDHTRNMLLRALAGNRPGESDVRGFSGACIATFGDLLERLAPAEAASPMTEARWELLVRRLLRELELPEFNAVRDFGGFRQSLAEAAEEVRRAGLAPDALEAALPGSGRHRPFLRFYRAYEAAMAAAAEPEQARIRRACAAIRGGALPLRLLLVDGFGDFTAGQRELLAALVARVPAVRIALTLDRGPSDLFYQAARSREWLQSLADGPFEEIWLDGNRRPQSGTLAAVERALREGRAEVPPPLWRGGESLTYLAAADRRDEVELAAREVLRLARSGFRYRDIGIITRRQEDYAPLFRGVFRRLGIPLREFAPLSPLDTAAGRHLRLCLDLFRPGSRPESLFAWLKSLYSPVHSRRIVERFEYRAVQRLADAREGRWEKLELQPLLAQEIEKLQRLDSEMAESRSPAALARWMRRAWSELSRFDEIPDGIAPDRALELRAEAAALRRIPDLVGEVAAAAGAENVSAMDAAEFCELVLSLLAREQVFVRDRRQDAVNLLNPFEARQWELRAVLVVGLVEGEFPAPPREELFLDDRDRELVGRVCGRLLPASADRARDERFLFYVAATRARESLLLSHPQSDRAGAPLLRSFFLRPLEPLLEAETCRIIPRRRSEIVCPPELAAGTDDLLALAHVQLASRQPDRKRACALTLYETLRAGGVTARAAAVLAPRDGRLRLEAALQFVLEKANSFSASALGIFADCPFKYFAEHTLRLKGGADPDSVGHLLLGKIAHAAIEKWERGGRSEPIESVLARCFEEGTEDIPDDYVSAKTRAEMAAYLARFAEAEKERPLRYRTEIVPEYVEMKFGLKDGGLPPLRLALDDGTEILIRGRMDRVEVARTGDKTVGLVLDFKYSPAGFDNKHLKKIREGVELQLPIYLLALAELTDLEPGGAELYPLKSEEGRCGIYREEMVGHIFQGAPGPLHVLSESEFREFLEQSRAWIRQHASAIRQGDVAVLPRSRDVCDWCNFSDVCRVKTWEVRQEREQATAI